MTLRKKFVVTLVGAMLALPALAQDNPAVGARQGQFKIYLHNFSTLGGMAQGRIDYDAAAAQTAADNLFHITRLDQISMWPAGTDSMSVDGTRAKPEIWENLDDFVAKYVALQTAIEGLQAVAGAGLDAMRGAVGPVGAACQACHQAYREES
ncbi:MAG: c-type cytochrome [Roseinatronobacter sp.]